MRAARLVAALSVVSLVGVTCAGQGGQDAESLRRQVIQSLDRGDPIAAARALGSPAANPALADLRGMVAQQLGRVEEADSVFQSVARSSDPRRTLAAARRAELLLSIGRTGEALAAAEGVASDLERRDGHSPSDWLALGIVYQVLGRRQPAQYKDALAAFDRAVAADSTMLEPRLRLGSLFLEKYNAPDARAAFDEVLQLDPGNPRARLGLAEAARFEGDRESFRMFDQVAKDAPNMARAHAMVAQLELDSEQPELAAAAADRAIALDSTQVDAWATKAAGALLAGDSSAVKGIEAGVRSWHRSPSGFYAAVAEAVARQRRYQVAAETAREAVAIDSMDSGALTTLGTNLLRLGAIDSGRARLAQAFRLDPYHVWNKNTLDLFDQTREYRTVVTGRFVFVVPEAEADLLVLYLAPMLERAYDSLAARYRYRPPPPVRLELYRRHADFSVRTVGLAGLGALGVSFGSVLAMDAPSARAPGDFNWASTAWHELTHAFTLGMTEHKVPRWLSEGLSVLEERRARTGWGAQPTVAFVSALKSGRLRPVSRLNDGFVRPSHPADVTFSYYQASLLCEFLESTFGFEAVLRLLEGYRRGESGPSAMRQATQRDIDEIGRRFDAWLRQRFETQLAAVGTLRDSVVAPGELARLMETAIGYEKAGQTDQAIVQFEKAHRLFPNLAEEDGPAWRLAELYRTKGDDAKAIEYYAVVTRYSESHLAANRQEALLRLRHNDSAGALAALERAIFISPYDPAVHVQAAEAAAAVGNHSVAVRERLAVVALTPADRAGALYQLAVAYRDAGDLVSARREVLRALEQAPSFEKAQQLLLDLKRGGS